MILGCTGHRYVSNQIGSPVHKYVIRQTKEHLEMLKPTEVISGAAIGFDVVVIVQCLQLGIPFIAAIPCLDQDKFWTNGQKEFYKHYLSKAKEVVMVSDGEYSAVKMQIRNQYIVDHCDALLCCWDGSQRGGTFNCMGYANQVGRDMFRIDPGEAK